MHVYRVIIQQQQVEPMQPRAFIVFIAGYPEAGG